MCERGYQLVKQQSSSFWQKEADRCPYLHVLHLLQFLQRHGQHLGTQQQLIEQRSKFTEAQRCTLLLWK